MEVIYVRHGAIDRGSPGDLSLSDVGRREARATPAMLANAETRASVWSSPLARAKETAFEIADTIGTELQIDPRLRERINFGDVSGQSFEEFHAMWRRCDEDRDLAPSPLSPSSRAAGEGLDAALSDLAAAGVRSAIVVSHGGVFSDLLRNALEEGRVDALPDLANIPHCSISRLRWSPDAVDIQSWASVAHLEGICG